MGRRALKKEKGATTARRGDYLEVLFACAETFAHWRKKLRTGEDLLRGKGD